LTEPQAVHFQFLCLWANLILTDVYFWLKLLRRVFNHLKFLDFVAVLPVDPLVGVPEDPAPVPEVEDMESNMEGKIKVHVKTIHELMTVNVLQTGNIQDVISPIYFQILNLYKTDVEW